MELAKVGIGSQEFYRRLLAEVRVLVVDDEEIIRDLLREVIGLEGFQCELSTNAEDAWEKIQSGRYDLLVCDKNLPGASGVELIQWVRDRGLALPSVIITGYASVSTVSEALEAGASDYIAKPFGDLLHVAQRLRRVIDRRLSGLVYAFAIETMKAEVDGKRLPKGIRLEMARALFSFKQRLKERTECLIVDQPSEVRDAIEKALDDEKVAFESIEGLSDLLLRVERHDPPLVVLIRLDLPELAALFGELERIDPYVEVLVFARRAATVEQAIDAVHAGATDFIIVGDEGVAAVRTRVLQALDRARRRRLNLHLLATLYRVAGRERADQWNELLAILPTTDRAYIERESAALLPDLPEQLDLEGLLEPGDEVPEPIEPGIVPAPLPDLGHAAAPEAEPEAAGADRRAHPRFSWPSTAFVVFFSGEQGQPMFMRASIRDVSKGGLWVEGEGPKIGERVMVHANDGQHDLSVVGRVVRVSNDPAVPGFGVAFADLETQLRSVLGKIGGA